MSGFLRRLGEGVAGAAPSRAALRPFVESIYGSGASAVEQAPQPAMSVGQTTAERAHEPDGSLEPFDEPSEMSEETRVEPEMEARALPATPSPRSPAPRSPPSPQESARPAADQEAALKGEFERVVSPSATDDGDQVSARRSPRSERPSAHAEPGSDGAFPTSASPLAAVISRLAPSESVEPPSSKHKPTDRVAAYEARVLAGAVARAASSAGATVERGNDVHIHIGRIEVLAAPASRPPAPPPTRKGPSLDEYLRRRSRNGGPS